MDDLVRLDAAEDLVEVKIRALKMREKREEREERRRARRDRWLLRIAAAAGVLLPSLVVWLIFRPEGPAAAVSKAAAAAAETAAAAAETAAAATKAASDNLGIPKLGADLVAALPGTAGTGVVELGHCVCDRVAGGWCAGWVPCKSIGARLRACFQNWRSSTCMAG